MTYFQDIKNAELTDYTGAISLTLRVVYVIIFQEGIHTRSRLAKICDSFMGKNFDIPAQANPDEINRKIEELNNRINDAGHLIQTSALRLREYLFEC